MDSKTRIGDDDSPLAAKAAAEETRADTAVREVSAIKGRIRQFYNEVAFVSFDEGAPIWAEGWLDFLLDGKVPVQREPIVIPRNLARVDTDTDTGAGDLEVSDDEPESDDDGDNNQRRGRGD